MIVAALSLLGSVFLSSIANGIAIFMIFGAGLVAGLLGNIGHVLNSPGLIHAAKIAAWAIPFEALYQDALRAITEKTSGLTGFLLRLGPFGGAEQGGVGLRLWAVAYSCSSARSPLRASRGAISSGTWAPTGDFCREAGVRDDELAVRCECSAAAVLVQVRQDERRHGLPVTPLRAAACQGFLDQRFDVVETVVGWTREQKAAAAELPVRLRDLRRLRGGLHPSRHGRPTVGRVEQRQRVRAKAEHRHAERLEHLHRRRDVEQRLDPGRDDEHLRARELAEVGGHVGWLGETA